MLRRSARAVVAAWLCWQWPVAIAANADDALQPQLAALAQSLEPQVRQTLRDIEGMPRQLLAARSYLRAGEGLASRWSWTDAEVAAFERSPRQQQMRADVERLTREFEAQNPGFSLYVNTQVRSLGVQLERWNKNRAVGMLADELLIAAAAATAKGQSLRQFLSEWQPSRAAPLAAPGLSLHGRAQALDFQVRKGESIVAGTEAASVGADWDAAGWSDKLRRAVERSKLPFRGPLLVPREPWHYEYVATEQPSGTRR